jgi:hypothetical protein
MRRLTLPVLLVTVAPVQRPAPVVAPVGFRAEVSEFVAVVPPGLAGTAAAVNHDLNGVFFRPAN